MTVGIKETKELIAGLDVIATTAIKVMDDGKINLSDLAYAMDLFKELNTLIESIKGLSELPTEFKDLDSAEIMDLGADAYALFMKIYTAIKN